jgi:hypothetical protein
MSKLPTRAVSIPSLSALSWLEGAWIGEEPDRLIEEHWTSPRGDGLMGMFRLMQGGAARFFEFMTIAVEEEVVVLRVKHFNPGLVGWEEKAESVEFALVRLDNQEALFFMREATNPKWLVYRRDGDEGEKPSTRFLFTRALPQTL